MKFNAGTASRLRTLLKMKESSPTLTEPPNALPTSWRCNRRQPVAGLWPTFLMPLPATASWSSPPCKRGRWAVSYIHPNAATSAFAKATADKQGPPTSSAGSRAIAARRRVQVNPGVPCAAHHRLRPTELAARPRLALATACRIAPVGSINRINEHF